jgi:lipoyl(octanoyl) transferase
MKPELDVQWLGEVEYEAALRLQMQRVEERRAGSCGDTLLLLEHPPVVTLGSSAHEENLLASREELTARGVALHEIRRGGDVTYHAPGQLVGYLIADLAARGPVDVGLFLRSLEAALIDALATLGVPAKRIDGMTGVYVDRSGEAGAGLGPERKIASIGIGVRAWVSFHGFALNVSMDLAGFDVIVPCGLSGVEMTSLARELGSGPAELDERARTIVAQSFAKRFG